MSCDLMSAHVNPVSTTLPHRIFFNLVMNAPPLTGSLIPTHHLPTLPVPVPVPVRSILVLLSTRGPRHRAQSFKRRAR